MLLRQMFDRESSTYTYLLGDERTKQALLIDAVRELAERDLGLLRELGLTLAYVLDTHTHADHVTGAGNLRTVTGAKVLGALNGPPCADLHLRDGELLECGDIQVRVLATPGHTDDSLCFLVGDKVFTGDTLLIRAVGRTDFQNGSAEQLYESITTKLFSLPDDTVVYPAHDYQGLTMTTIGEEKRFNRRIASRSRDEFVQVMHDLHLARPKKIDEAVPANRACGVEWSAPAGRVET